MPRTKEQYEQIRKDRRSQIMDTALEMFAREGYGHVSIAALSQRAGISKGLMYNYFSSKEELLREILNEAIDQIMTSLDPNRDGILTEEEFEHFVRKTFQLMHEKRAFFTRFFSMIIQPNVRAFLKESSLVPFMEEYLRMFDQYFSDLGFEDPMLEVFELSVILEGLGIMMLYYDELADLPPELFKKYEERIINKYTSKQNEKK
jgi:AcrR family transcriptional regulator